MSKHFRTTTTGRSFSYAGDQAAMAKEIMAEAVVRTYKQLAVVEKVSTVSRRWI